MKVTSERFEENAREALADETLHGALARATGLFSEMRRVGISDVPDWEPMRERARVVKADTLLHLDEYLLQFVERAEAAGTVVHWARDSAEACRLIGDLVQRTGSRRLVKSKSMTTEEIGLNEALERDMDTLPIETDLGEWIIQLAGELPSHIIAPAIHKTKAQIADLFVEKLSIEPTDDIDDLTLAAREVLRQHFAQADLGISGVNFAIAETGTILILENEGNARLTTSLPRVHVAVMGIEKLLPKFADLEVFLRLLPRSGTGQHLTSYQSILTGPVGPDGEGPEEMHIVLLDNGRSAMLAERVTRQSLACIRCGACLNVCPVYQQIGGHAYGSVYPGPIGSIITPQLSGLEKAAKLPFASSLCGACRDVCPVKIDIPELLLDLRARVIRGDGSPAVHKASGTKQFSTGSKQERRAFRMWAAIMASPRRFALVSRLARFVPGLNRRGAARGLRARLAPPLAAWTAARELRPLARTPFRRRWKNIARGDGR